MTPTTISIDTNIAPSPEKTPDFNGLSPYQPISRAAALETFVPASMAYETRQALLRLAMFVKPEYGNVDNYVCQKLHYPDVATLHQFFAAEQIDALALAIFNIETGEGMIIGDQTGIGKGRIAAGIIRYGCMSGQPTIFITEKPTLFSDIYRDLYDIGSLELVPLIINTDPLATIQINLDENTIVRVHEHLGNDNYKPKTLQQLRNLLHEYDGDDFPVTYEEYSQDITYLPPGYNFLMATYSQLSDDLVAKAMMQNDGVIKRSKEVKKSPSQFKTTFVANYARNAIVILDEAHNASGGQSATGYFIKYGVLDRCRGCCYLSATFAKRPDNMPVYAGKTAIKHANLTSLKLEEAFAKGGVSLQEIVAGQLVASGQMLRRQRGFEGITVEYNYLPEQYSAHADTYDRIIRLVDAIIAFEREYVESKLEELAESLGFGGDEAQKTKGTKEGGINNSPFFNKTHHIIRQLLFSIKAKDVAREAVRLLGEDKKVVIAFSSTMESFVDELGLVNGQEVVNADFALVLQRSLENALKYTVSSGSTMSGTYRSEQYTLEPGDFDPEGASILQGLKNEIAKAATGIMLSPIDTLINEIQSVSRPGNIGGEPGDFYRVRECTGRKGQMRFEDGVLVYRTFKANVKQFFAEFNSGAADVLLINQSAATGVSAHASAKFKDKRQRWMIIHQPELDINFEVQKRGRINRTGQVNKPGYLYVSSSIPAEKRIFMVLKRKLKSLDANTTGSQRSSQQQLETEDFFNKYGNQVVAAFLHENLEIAARLDLEQDKPNEETGTYANVTDLAETFSRRIALLPVKEQERAYKEITEKYDELIADLKERGEYDLEVEYLDLQAETEDKNILVLGSGAKSPFGRHAVMETVSAKVLRRPMKWSEVEVAMKKSLDGKTAEALQTEMLFEYENGRKALLAAQLKRIERDLAVTREKLNKPVKGDKESSVEKIQEKISKLEDDLATKQASIQAETNNGLAMLRFYKVGHPFKFKRGEREYIAVVTNVYFSKPQGDDNRYSHSNIRVMAAVYGPERVATLKFNQIETIAALQLTKYLQFNYFSDLIYNWNRLDVNDAKRERLQLVTNNVLLGIAEVEKGKLIKFSHQNGAIRSGIYLEVERTRSGEAVLEKPKTKLPITFLTDEIMLSRPDGQRFYVIGTETKSSISFQRKYGGTVQVTMPSTGAFKKYYGDDDLLELIEFRGASRSFKTWIGNIFEAFVSEENLPDFLKILWDKHQLTYTGNPLKYDEAEDAPLFEEIVEAVVVETVRNPTPDDAKPAYNEVEAMKYLQMLEIEMA